MAGAFGSRSQAAAREQVGLETKPAAMGIAPWGTTALPAPPFPPACGGEAAAEYGGLARRIDTPWSPLVAVIGLHSDESKPLSLPVLLP
eukprot:CAMPEP_0172819138 /NCGR_PEP_ID=MMETSP1075-20121228/14390_1 /TAXON_ID=2916 /ORGANISM="Ceratium fusus, Strain PA161109" /LENGTH=88 /DNA_ID=CAMNT_0013659605 /DNA_START=29 /DNA_END=292 /DNA_ORIENTATION=+